MEQVPHVAMYCHEEKDEHQWMHLVPSFLLPLVVRYLTDVNNQVRKTAQAALLVLLEQELVAHNDVEDQVCPLLLMLTNADAHDDFRTEAAALMCRMAPLLGGDLSRRVFLERFAALSADGLFHVRKICAANFGEFCAVVGQEVTESTLLDKFYALCQDELWGVRKACAEVFMSLSRVVSATKRRNDLGSLFVNLLQDESRWVRMAAFQALGPFISTFSRMETENESTSSPSAAPVEPAESESSMDQSDFNSFYFWRDPLPQLNLTSETNADQQPEENKESVSDSVEKALEDLMARVELGRGEAQPAPAPSNELVPEPVHAFDLRRVACQELLGGPVAVSKENGDTTASTPNDLSGDSKPTSDIQPTLLSSSITTSLATVMSSSSLFQPNLLPPAYVKSNNDLPTTVYSNSFCPYYSPRRRSDGGSMSGGVVLDTSRSRPYSPYGSSSMRSSISLSQSVVPQSLMDYYLQMTDPYYVETVDAEITRHCAYSLPAVVCTLGKEHWPLLRDLYTTLASDMQWKVRRTLASSIHEIGAILGQEVVTQDLLPVFDGFIKDLDEVRIGVLKHLSDFLRLLPERERRSYLPRLADFLKLDNEQNWRFRQELALQLQSVVGLFSPADSAQSILPLALTLASDRVAAVRLPAFTLVSQIMKQVSENSWAEDAESMLTPLLADLTTRFCSGNRWMLRQSYVNICNQLVTDRALPLEEFAKLLLAPLLALKQDRVPNVRLVLARVINFQLKYHEFFSGSDSPYRESLDETLNQLSADKDRDVSYYATCSTVKRDQTQITSDPLPPTGENAA
ncbi:serine/threonine-protein phosphatase 4 regulatory subunit 1-like isoform X1 [Daphnia carinata]|nr:serine/threonine-protein phosphatase 4 regulatory subunit 1-like isoform X1 [Daphnia carinata]